MYGYSNYNYPTLTQRRDRCATNFTTANRRYAHMYTLRTWQTNLFLSYMDFKTRKYTHYTNTLESKGKRREERKERAAV